MALFADVEVFNFDIFPIGAGDLFGVCMVFN